MGRQPSDTGEPAPAKTRRSKNGCNECRRLHRRCDEGKPECQNCRDAGKSCSYNRTLSWGGRPFGKSPFRAALEGGVGEIETGSSIQASGMTMFARLLYGWLANAEAAKSFVYGQISSSEGTPRSLLKRTRSVPSATLIDSVRRPSWPTSSGTSSPLAYIPWLSEHHRMLFDHFTNATIGIFHDNPAIQLEIKSIMVPMAADTNHGFSLLASILSLASTHRMILGFAQDQAEIEYWRDMSIGHLRRPGIQEDGSTDNVFAATALILCIRDAISGGGRPLSWRLHLQGASTTLRKTNIFMSPIAQETRAVLRKLAISIQFRSLLPLSATAGLDKMQHETTVAAFGMSEALVEVLKDIRKLRLERLALQAFESNSGTGNMGPLWAALRGRCVDIVVRADSLVDGDVAIDEGMRATNALYGRAAVLQVYSGVLQLDVNNCGVRSSVEAAVKLLRAVTEDISAKLSVMLIFPVFTIGCLVTEEEDKALVIWLLTRIAAEHGKANATLACDVLQELWGREARSYGVAETRDLEEWTTAKGWDLSLW